MLYKDKRYFFCIQHVTHPAVTGSKDHLQLIYEKLATEKIAILNGSRRVLLALKNSIQNFW
jgi:hypothetical protein